MSLQPGASTATTVYAGTTNIAYSADVILDDPQCFSCKLYFPDDLNKNCRLANTFIMFNKTIQNAPPEFKIERSWWIKDCPDFKAK